MIKSGTKRLLEFFIFGAGIFFFCAVLRSFGFSEVFSVVGRAGPLVFAAFFFYPLMCLWDVAAWKMVFSREAAGRVRMPDLFWIRLAGEAVNNVTPFFDLGGEPLKVKLLQRRLGLSFSQAVAATLAGKTSLLLSEAFFMTTGVLFSFKFLTIPAKSRLELSILLFCISAAFFLFLYLQQKGAFRRLDPTIQHFYSQEKDRFWTAVPLNWMGWIFGGIEMTFYCRLAGVEITLLEGVMLEALLQLVRTGSFFIPMSLGAQEGGMAFFLGLMGYPPIVGVGISLLKRFRQLLWTAAGFGAWGFFEYCEAKKKSVPLSGSEFVSFDTGLDAAIHRPLANLIARLLSKAPVTPNQVTFCALIPALLSAAFFSIGSFWAACLALLFFYLWSVLDHVDGALARIQNRVSKWGQAMDDICDVLGSSLFYGAFSGDWFRCGTRGTGG